MSKKRTNINITEKEHILLLKEMENTGLSMSEIIRRALDEYFKKKKK
jgi:hypothetical protein